MKSESRGGTMETTFVNHKPGQPVLVNGVPGVIVGVRLDKWGLIIEIKVNGSTGDYTPADFISGIISIVAQEKGI